MLEAFFEQDSTGVLLIAPPGSGKTYILKELSKQQSLVFISPLKALSLEFCKNIQGISLLDKTFKQRVHILETLPKSFVVVLTAELLTEDLVEFFYKKNVIFVIDEIHLFYYWGKSFRPYLQDLIEILFSLEVKVLMLTATFSFFDELLFQQSLTLNTLYVLDYQNKSLGFLPEYHCHYWKFFLILRLRIQLYLSERSLLIFCKTRYEVDDCYNYLSKKFNCVFQCKGGETVDFQNKIEDFLDKKVIIISTIALSHGVNLPSISDVFILYKVEEEDFWIQMVRRAGRDKKSYKIFSMNSFYKSDIVRDIKFLRISFKKWLFS